ncbi:MULTISPECIES: tyrosine-type recombinase/integrase [Haloarcula]|uniref:tyrosine-type recombinase/integrase n=1 Tax=Haloarcula TaxID=2237 RepID=UPI0023E8836E|nr:site-specific integrase [Halomicroarcula sp. SHR3]
MSPPDPESNDNILGVDFERNIVLIPGDNDAQLSEKQRVDYRSYRESFLNWLYHLGKDPESAQGYSPYTVFESGYRAAAFDRWVWETEETYTVPPTRDHADAYLQETAYNDMAQATKGKVEEMLRRYYRWLQHKYGHSEWEPEFSFQSSGSNAPRDFLTVDERRKIRQAALDHGSIPSYEYLDADDRARWKSYVARVTDTRNPSREDWEKVDGWKITSMVWTSLDAGLRPIEVGRAKTTWVDINNGVLRIPREESSKNKENWTVSLTDRTANALDRWLAEREHYDRYEDTDALWLTTHGNPYASKSLSRLLKRLCGEAGIPVENRQMSWYSIRHSVGTYMTREEGLAAAQSQLRHKSSHTTMKYDQTPVEDRREALDRMG